ncbi:phosphate-starvation-inducible protein PsiE [Sandarakinorhabdus limnophila]|jgi:protein PsiE|uniref:phosphate-starvation-inducible protein PsiE n=2 Tax=Sandarakinorhabdus limnophila TaxID=210512 RepID=UPI0026EDF1C3|nr:phosphate-starvation-inducible PsiE family protein [Sandarakinorhabdus limnophila]MCM0031932.1 phosphate-starvation-inducible PsiE family protein [Sandarakinorhabdus limnophila]
MTPEPSDGLSPSDRARALLAFRFIERGLLFLIALLTLGAVALELIRVWQAQNVNLADILLMFLYTEVIGMVAAFYVNSSAPVVYPIFIAITALARLIVLQGKEMAPQSIIFEASAILLLAVAATILIRFRQKPN